MDLKLKRKTNTKSKVKRQTENNCLITGKESVSLLQTGHLEIKKRAG